MLIRRASRLLLIDEVGRVLLFQYADERGKWWATPGGGLEGSETFEQAAAREAREELGLTEFSLTRLWERTTEFQSKGLLIRQTERYFLVHWERCGDPVLSESVREAHALEGILAVRWWLANEIRVATERVFPEDLVMQLERIAEM